MNLLRNREIADKYNISFPTVIKWAEDAVLKKNHLIIHDIGGKLRIEDNENNVAELARLAESSKKFRSKIVLKKVEPSQKFYKTYTVDEAIEIVDDLEFKKQVNLKYGYKDIGAKSWDEFYLSGESPVKNEVSSRFLSTFREALFLHPEAKKFNIIDIGPGNGYPVKEVLQELQEKNFLDTYICIDISEEMNQLAVSNIKKWFPDIKIKSYNTDIEITRLSRLFLENKSSDQNESNLVLYLDGLCNHDDTIQVLKNIRRGLARNDLVVLGFTIDTNKNRSALSYVKNDVLDRHNTLVLKMLGIDTEKCDLEVRYDSNINSKIKVLKLDKDYELTVKLINKTKKIELYAGEEITVWKHFLFPIDGFLKELTRAGLKILNLQIDKSYSYALVICQPDIDI
jgi:uncharacterized SAM-dependent methyltransferase